MIARTEGSFPPSQSNLRHSSPKMLNAKSLSCRRQSSRNRSLQTSKGNCNSFMTYGRATLTPDSCGPKRQLTPNCRGMNYKILKPTFRILNVGDPFSGVSVTAIFSTARSGCQPATTGFRLIAILTVFGDASHSSPQTMPRPVGIGSINSEVALLSP